MYHVQKCLLLISLVYVIEKHTTSFKSGISIKSFNFAYFLSKNHNVKTAFRERIVQAPVILVSEARVPQTYPAFVEPTLRNPCGRISAPPIKRPLPNKWLWLRVNFKVLMRVILATSNSLGNQSFAEGNSRTCETSIIEQKYFFVFGKSFFLI